MRSEKDLFGHPIAAPALRKVGYPARPGTGPKKKRCSLCAHFSRVRHEAGEGIKCQVMSHAWTTGKETDIHPNAPACLHFENKPYGEFRRVG